MQTMDREFTASALQAFSQYEAYDELDLVDRDLEDRRIINMYAEREV